MKPLIDLKLIRTNKTWAGLYYADPTALEPLLCVEKLWKLFRVRAKVLHVEVFNRPVRGSTKWRLTEMMFYVRRGRVLEGITQEARELLKNAGFTSDSEIYVRIRRA